MSAFSGIRSAVGMLFGYPRVQGGVVPNYPEQSLGTPFQLPTIAWDFPLAMRKVAMVRRCVLRIANDLARLPVVFEVQQGEDFVAIKREPGNIVDIWAGANPEDTGFEMVRDLHAHRKTSGTAYMIVEDFGTGRPQELWTIPSHLTQVIVGANRKPEAYVFTRMGKKESVPAANVIPFRSYNPEFQPIGSSDLESVELEYATNYDISRLMQAFVRNGGMPAGYWSVTGTDGKSMVALTEPQQKQLKARLNKLYAGLKNAFSAHVVGDMKFERAGLTPEEMKLIEIAKLSDERICLAIGVPPWMVGLKGGNSGVGDKGGSAQADVELYWENTLFPEIAGFEAVMTEKFCPRFGRNIRARVDLSQVAALNDRIIKNAAGISSLAGRPAVTVNQVLELIGKPKRMEPEADMLYVKPEPAPIGGAVPGDAASMGTDAGKQAPVDTPARSSRMIDGDAMRETRRRAASANLRRYERKLQEEFYALLNRQKDRICSALESNSARSLHAARNIDAADLADVDPADEEAVRNIFAALVADRGEEALADLALELELAFNANRTSGWVAANAQRVLTQTSATTRASVREAIRESLSLNESLSALVERIRALPTFDTARAALIARTESTGAYNYASREAWVQSGVVDKQEWLSARDDQVRDTHSEVDGDVVGIGESFKVGDSMMEFPGDPAGGPEETCNCRCTLIPVVDETARSRKNFDGYLARILRGAKREGVAR